MTKILDLSHHQNPSKINYDQLAKEVDLVIIRTQYGSLTVDNYYKTHHAEFKKRGVPCNAYAWVRGASIADMKKEATDFFNRTKELSPVVWWLDVEENSMKDMRSGVSAYVGQLRALGVQKIGIYIAHHLYKTFNLDLNEVDAVWIPRYGTNNGQQQTKPDYPCCLWQYTSVGRLPGYDGYLDINVLNGDKSLDWFTGTIAECIQAALTPAAPVQPKPAPQVNASSIVPYPGYLIKEGSRGKDVERVQRAVGVTPDGKFGPKTEEAVKLYQARHRLVVDGKVGPRTWSMMF